MSAPFVIIFRQGPQTLSEDDKARRARETSAWASRVNAAGHELNPHILGPEGNLRGAQGVELSTIWPITALLTLKARDLAEATAIAEEHPALRFGSSVEIRPWARPVVPPKP